VSRKAATPGDSLRHEVAVSRRANHASHDAGRGSISALVIGANPWHDSGF